MPNENAIETIRWKYENLKDTLNERSRRHWAATEALALGRGGIRMVVVATGIATNTVRTGIKEIEEKKESGAVQSKRIRRKGGGRKRIIETDQSLMADLEQLVEPITRGDPENPLRWTSKGTEKLAEALREKGHKISADTVGRLLKSQNYSLQSNRKRHEGKQHPDRDAQFEHISKTANSFHEKQQPVISVDTKKKELIGNFKNSGTDWQKKGSPIEVNVYDFVDKELGKAIPHGVYDILNNEGWVSVGIDHDTAEFAIASIRQWWLTMGKERYPKAKKILITADGGGSNSRRSRLWKFELQQLADELQIPIHVCHFPPGTSKWNKIEHRMFSFITKNWRGQPLLDRATVVNLIANTTTQAGLKINATIDPRSYPTGKKISDEQLAALRLKLSSFHGEWNYKILPRLIPY